MEPRVSQNLELSRFEIHLDGEIIGFADYVMRDSILVLPHTEIDPKFGGRGFGGVLVDFILDFSIAEGLKVDPQCPFVLKAIRRGPSAYKELVPLHLRSNYDLEVATTGEGTETHV